MSTTPDNIDPNLSLDDKIKTAQLQKLLAEKKQIENDLENKKETSSEKFKNVALGVAGVLIPLLGFYFSYLQHSKDIQISEMEKKNEQTLDSMQKNQEFRLSALQKDKEISKNYIELGITILSSKPTPGSDSLRTWAVKVVNKYSDTDLKLNYNTQHQLISTISILGVNENNHPLPPKVQDLDLLKTRSTFPSETDINKSIKFTDLIAPDANENKFSAKTAVEITAYISAIYMGGPESSNSFSKNKDDYNVRLYLSTGPDVRDRKYQIIAQVTPAVRKIAAKSGKDYSFETLKNQFLHKEVKIQGWLLYNFMHKGQSFADNPDLPNPQRATCWEITPITKITALE